MRGVTKSMQALHPLQHGDRLTRAEFERRFDITPGLKKAELIEGEVHMPPPVGAAHGTPHLDLSGWIFAYRAATPGIIAAVDASMRFDFDNMPQPDLALMICPENGGQTHVDDDGYYAGVPELVAEISSSSVSFDMHKKKELYRRQGVREYLVWLVREDRFDWYVLKGSEYVELQDRDGVFDSTAFPGLRLDAKALLTGDPAGVLRSLHEAINSESHRKFVAELAARKK